MLHEFLIFLKISVFFIGFTLFSAYICHRIAFLFNIRALDRLYPGAFDRCFQIVTSFYDVIKPSSTFEAHRFLSQIASRQDMRLPRAFRDLPVEITREVYHMLRKHHEEFQLNPSRVMASIRDSIFQTYLQAYRFRIINESLDWLLIFIPFAGILGIILPVILYLQFRFIVDVWPISLTLGGLSLGVIALIFILKDYLLKR